MRTFRLTPIAPDTFTATDLREQVQLAADAQLPVETYAATIFDAAGENPHPERAEVLYLPSENRLGIAWGADATWATAADAEDGVRQWLTDGEAWSAAN